MGLIRFLGAHVISWCMLEYICWASLVSLGVGLVLEMSSSASQVFIITGASRPAQGSTVDREHFIGAVSMTSR